MQPGEAARILLRRRRMRDSLAGFAQSIQIPGSAVGGDDSELFEPVGSGMALHHRIMCDAIQRCIETPYGRLIIMLPPGSAKSTYASAIAPAWAMGRTPGTQVILTSYGTELAKKHSRKARAICKQAVFMDAFAGDTISRATSAAEQWSLNSGSEYMAAGILAGVTGSRADIIIGDDLIAGRQEADSPAVRTATNNAWMEDIMTRQKPRASVILLGTRWHPLDPIGALLPANYKGESGPVLCSDGMVWQVLCIPAQCEREDDPCGRQVGEYLWPEVWGAEHFIPFQSNARTWASLYQQRPAIDGGGRFKREWVKWYEPGEQPGLDELNIYGASDWGAPSETTEEPDFTEHGVVGTDDSIEHATGLPAPHLWFLDWYYGQETTDVGMREFFRLVTEWRPRRWWNEKGPIYNAIKPTLDDRMRRSPRRTWLDALPSSLNKIARAESFFDIAAQGRVHMPNVPWAHRLVDMLCQFPVVVHDDGVDVCSLLGRAVGSLAWKRPPPVEEHKDLKPFSQAWLFYNEAQQRRPGGRTR